MKSKYKKALTSLRNTYIDLTNESKSKMDKVYNKSLNEQIDYLNKVTFNLITSDNKLKYNIGNFIAYGIFKKRTYKNLLYITLYNMIEINELQSRIRYYEDEKEKIFNTITFINSVSENELNKYLKYKIN